MKYGALVRKRESIIREIRALRKRHRRRKPLLNVLIKLTLLQLKQEMRAIR